MEESFECHWKQCSLVTKDIEAFKIHVLSHTTDEMEKLSSIKCSWKRCGLTVVGNKARLKLLRHLLGHCHVARLINSGESYRRKHKLSPCQMPKFLSKELLAVDLERPRVCSWDECPYRTDDPDAYFIHVNAHLKRQSDERGQPWCCFWEGCKDAEEKKAFRNVSNLKLHLRSHTKEKLLSCAKCEKQFSSLENFRDHLIKQDKEKLKSLQDRFKCKICDESFPRRPELTNHIQTAHPVRSIKCPLCPRSCHSQSKLDEHINAMHSAVRDVEHSCPHCESKYKTRRGVLEHVRAQHQRSFFRCLECPFKAKVYSHLWRHYVVEHDQRHFSCHVCGYRAKAPSYFSRHLRQKHNLSPTNGYKRFRYRCTDEGTYQVLTDDPNKIENLQKNVDDEEVMVPSVQEEESRTSPQDEDDDFIMLPYVKEEEEESLNLTYFLSR